MVTPETVHTLALSFPETEETSANNILSFQVRKKVFATLNTTENRACFRFSPIDQQAFCSFPNTPFFRVPNAWGKYGWTLVDLARADEELLIGALTTAYCEAAPKDLAAPFLELDEDDDLSD